MEYTNRVFASNYTRDHVSKSPIFKHSEIRDRFQNITLFRSIAVLCGTDNIMQNIPHIQFEYEEYAIEYYQSHKTLS